MMNRLIGCLVLVVCVFAGSVGNAAEWGFIMDGVSEPTVIIPSLATSKLISEHHTKSLEQCKQAQAAVDKQLEVIAALERNNVAKDVILEEYIKLLLLKDVAQGLDGAFAMTQIAVLKEQVIYALAAQNMGMLQLRREPE